MTPHGSNAYFEIKDCDKKSSLILIRRRILDLMSMVLACGEHYIKKLERNVHVVYVFLKSDSFGFSFLAIWDYE